MGKPESGPVKVQPVQIFKQGVALWQKKFAQLSKIFLVFYLPIFAAALLPLLPGLDKAPSFVLTVVGIILQIAMMAAGIWGMIALLLAAAREAAEPLKITLKTALKRFWPFVGTSLLTALISMGCVVLGMILMAVMGATMAAYGAQMHSVLAILIVVTLVLSWAAAIIALVIFSLRFALVGFVCALEQAGPVASLKRSWALTRKRLAPILGTMMLIGILALVLMIPAVGAMIGTIVSGGPAQAPELPLGLQLFFHAYSFGAYFVVIPLQTCIFLRLYNAIKEATR